MERREFLKIGSAAVAALAAGGSVVVRADGKLSESNRMTFRKDRKTGEDIGVLGYGCMRWPTVTGADGQKTVDQNRVNELTNYAIANGVN